MCDRWSFYLIYKDAKDIGQNYTFDRENHPTIHKILDQNFGTDIFNFRPADQKTVSKIIRKFNVKKASGFDKISIKLLKLWQQSLVPLLTNLVNNTIMSGIVPRRLKFGQVTPIFQKKMTPWTRQTTDPWLSFQFIKKLYTDGL